MKQHRLALRLPVRRKLLAGSVAYLSGIYLTGIVCVSGEIVIMLSVLFLGAGVLCLARRKSALFYVLAVMLLLGNWRAGSELRVRDEATAPGVQITGTVSKIVSDRRVYLDNVLIEGEAELNRPAVVTLMVEEGESGNPDECVSAVQVGQQVRGTGRLFEQDAVRNPGGVDWRINALCDGYELSGYLLPGWHAQGKARFSISDMFRRAKEALSERIGQLFGGQAPLFQAVMIGDRAQMDGDLVQAMRLAGIAHLLTVSGMHLSVVAQVLRATLGKLRVHRRAMLCMQAVLLGCFVCLTGGATGTVRAYIMAMMRELAACTGRRYDSLTALGTAALIMTLVRPVWALSASFQFSFFVVLGILLLSGQLSKLLGKGQRRPAGLGYLTRMTALTASAQLAAMPMQLALYGYVPLLALPMNLFSGMLMPFMMLGGWGVLAISPVSHELGTAAAGALGGLAELLERLSMLAARQTWGIVRIPAPYMVSLILTVALMFAASRKIRVRRGRAAICCVLSAALVLAYLPRLYAGTEYVQLDVGQGDGAVIRTGRRAVLVDVGPEDEYAMLHYLRHEGLHVDLVILSHLDEDHAGALGVLLDSEVMINRIAMPAAAFDDVNSGAVSDALSAARQMGIEFEFYQRGETISAGGVTLCVLSPDDSLSGSNERSLVLFSEIEGMKLLTLGDLPTVCEMEDVPPCDILKVAHHGSRNATSKALLEKAKPAAALISVGRNSYGHPADRVLEDLAAVGADVYRTDESGCLTVTYERGMCKVTPFIK